MKNYYLGLENNMKVITYFFYIATYSRMGTCLTSPRTIRKTKDTCSIIQNKRINSFILVSPSEVTILRLLYKDLAERVDSHKINLENFLLFFHKNGYWGERLFK